MGTVQRTTMLAGAAWRIQIRRVNEEGLPCM
jgi:hypothetical protein